MFKSKLFKSQIKPGTPVKTRENQTIEKTTRNIKKQEDQALSAVLARGPTHSARWRDAFQHARRQ
jgi:hypothetical protein